MSFATLVGLVILGSGPPPVGEAGGSKTWTYGSRRVIDAALSRLYAGQRPSRFEMKPDAGEKESPLAEVVVYRATVPVPHWHYVTYGLSELSAKTSSDSKLSGFGVEYSLRLVDPSEKPPLWPIKLLRFLAKQTWETRYPYDPGHSANLPRSVLENDRKGVEALAFYEDEQLRSIDTPTGRLAFVNVIPLMAGEYSLIGSWDADKVAAELRAVQRALLWQPGRKSLLDGPRRKAILARVDAEGSSQSVDFSELACSPNQITLDSLGLLVFDKVLRHRLPHGRDAQVISRNRVTRLTPGDWQFQFGEESCLVSIPAAQARALADEIVNAPEGALITRPGGLRLRVKRFE